MRVLVITMACIAISGVASAKLSQVACMDIWEVEISNANLSPIYEEIVSYAVLEICFGDESKELLENTNRPEYTKTVREGIPYLIEILDNMD